MLLPKGVLRLIMRYRLEAMIVDQSINYKIRHPKRTMGSLWIVDWYYTFIGPYDLYKVGSVVWKYSMNRAPTYLYDIEKL